MNRKNAIGGVLATATTTLSLGQIQPPGGYAMQFNGSNAFVQIADNSLLDFQRTVTLEAWIKPSSTTNPYAEVIGQGDGVNYYTDRAFHFGWDSSNGQFAGEFFRSDGGIRYGYWCSNNATPTNQWIHICVTFDGNAGLVRAYRNGALDAERTTQCGSSVTFGPFAVRNSTRPMEIGRRWITCCQGPSLYFSGLIDEVRLWNIVRTPTEIAATFNTSVPTNSPGLVAYYTFDEGSGSAVADRTGHGLSGVVNGGATWVVVPPACTAPTITSNPTSQTVCATSPVTLSIAAGGTGPSLQWRKDGVNISGANAASYVIASTSLADAGVYDCIATNACGTATSTSATLTVTPRFAIATQPIDQAVGVDAPVSFLVQMEPIAGCAAPVTFQWQRRDPSVADPNAANAWITLVDGPQFVNTTTSGLIIAHPIPALGTGYRCKIGGGCGCRPASGFIYSDVVNFSVACPADFNADGGIDFGDVEAFFERWENGC